MTQKIRAAILISGRGSNMTALIDAAGKSDFPVEIALVLSNKPDAAGLGKAQAAGLDTAIVNHKAYPDRHSFEAALTEKLRTCQIDLVCLAGFMRVLTEKFIHDWQGKLINIHPSLLPSFKGLDTHQRALDAGVKLAGCTVHHVVPEVDSGPIIAQAVVPVLPNDNAQHLAMRVLAAEHRLYPHALRLLAGGFETDTDSHAHMMMISPPERD